MTAIETPYEAPSATSEPLSENDMITVNALYEAISKLDNALSGTVYAYGTGPLNPICVQQLQVSLAKHAATAKTIYEIARALRNMR